MLKRKKENRRKVYRVGGYKQLEEETDDSMHKKVTEVPPSRRTFNSRKMKRQYTQGRRKRFPSINQQTNNAPPPTKCSNLFCFFLLRTCAPGTSRALEARIALCVTAASAEAEANPSGPRATFEEEYREDDAEA